MFKICYYSFLLFFLSVSNSFAYIDPGTGSIIITAIVGMFLYIVVYVKYFFSLIKKQFNRLKNAIKKKVS